LLDNPSFFCLQVDFISEETESSLIRFHPIQPSKKEETVHFNFKMKKHNYSFQMRESTMQNKRTALYKRNCNNRFFTKHKHAREGLKETVKLIFV